MTNFNECLKRKKIFKFSRGRLLAYKEYKLAIEDFNSAKMSLDAKNFKWAIIQTYYAMFHSARALIYNKNYRERSHFCLIEAVKEFYVKNKQIDIFLIESLLKAKHLREDADYYGDFSKLNAKNLLNEAKKFIQLSKKIINNDF